jgi:hypothetical protein
MPRGRGKQSAREAKNDSITRIESALAEVPNGLRFGELKEKTRLHQDTLSIRLKKLITEEKVLKIEASYKLSEDGVKELGKLQLLDLIARSPGLSLAHDGAALEPAETLIRKSTAGYAFPGITLGSLQAAMSLTHKYFMLHLLEYLIRNRLIDGRRLVANPSAIIEDLKRALLGTLPEKQVLAFTLDRKTLVDCLQEEYIRELLRVARVEDSNHIENSGTCFIDSYQTKTP